MGEKVTILIPSKTAKARQWCDVNVTKIYLSMRDGGLNGNRINKIMRLLKELEETLK